MPSKRELIQNKAVELIKGSVKGLRWSELQRELRSCFPDISPNTITGSTWNLDVTRPNEITKPTRGLFKYRLTSEEETEEIAEETPATLREEEFYEPFANCLKTDLGECTEAVALGGSYLGKRWGTTDVIGIYKPLSRDVIKFNPEIISAEIKINSTDPITAFGQAIAYRLFSSKVYLVEPNTILPEDLDRIEALCILFGVGLILFDLNPETPNFIIRVRAQRYTPDMFYVNEFADKLYNTKRDIFDKLF
ncbi:MAG: hypothetical protein SVN78_04220 [Deferribacterota bacterium]|nr:hypothetical protein [Deferribacterota bacterium]